jgi:hypothetical protein
LTSRFIAIQPRSESTAAKSGGGIKGGGNQFELISDSRPLYSTPERGETRVLLEQTQPTTGPIQHMVPIPTKRVAT